jgi:hypothetical protein
MINDRWEEIFWAVLFHMAGECEDDESWASIIIAN